MRVLATVTTTVALLLAGLTTQATQAAPEDFSTPPATLTGAPGDVVRQEPSTFYLDPLRALKAPASVQRLMYVSRGVKDEKIAVTGTLLTPRTPWVGRGKRPLVSYAVGTQGMADRCAPSRQLAAGTEYEGAFVKGLLTRGYAVVVTDYQGLGTPGTHAYANSRSLGRSVLDAARAATRSSVDRVAKDAPVFVAGYSEGGGGAAGALEQHASYAPDVNLKAGYAGAVPADLTRVAPGLDGSLYAAFLAYSVLGLDDLYPELRIGDLLTPAGQAKVDSAGETCTADGLAPFAFTRTSTLTREGRPVTDYLSRPDLAAVLEGLRLGKGRPDVPVLVAHTTLDDVVPFAQDRDMARGWCRNGATVTFAPGVAPTHVGGAVEAFPKAFAFLEARVAGVRPTSSCGRF
ncbi:lipase family protein [Solicola sp. PLA-1-18]|uniref:lipase family protein n=1 Tax=Solicola sp. PLA-1-18 TaxID=3380532 RepID=UPI003B78180E